MYANGLGPVGSHLSSKRRIGRLLLGAIQLVNHLSWVNVLVIKRVRQGLHLSNRRNKRKGDGKDTSELMKKSKTRQ